jgi:WD40 repeat protein
VDGKNLGFPFPGGKPDTSQAYNIPAGRQNLELMYYIKMGKFTVRGIKIEYDFLPGRTYAIVGEGKWGTGSYAVVDQGVRLRIMDTADDSLIHIRNPEKYFPTDITFSPDGSRIAFCAGKNIYVYNAADGALITTLSGKGIVTSVKFNANGDKLFSTSEDKTVRAWNLSGNAAPSVLITNKKNPIHAAWSADSSLLAMRNDRHIIEVYDTGTGQLLATFSGHEKQRGKLAFSPDGNRILSFGVTGFASVKTTVILWESRTGKQIAKSELNYGVSDIIWQPDGNRIALGKGGNEVVLIDDTLQEQGSANVFPEFSFFAYFISPWSPGLYFRPNSKELFCITTGGSVSLTASCNLLNIETGKTVHAFTCQSYSSSFYHAAYSPDGSRIALLSGDGVKVWNSDFRK